MNNNKQSMKLYTEEQVLRMLEVCHNSHLYQDIENFEDILKIETDIELPSNKDTTHLQWIYDRMSNVHGENENYDYMLKFKEIIEQLKEGSKL